MHMHTFTFRLQTRKGTVGLLQDKRNVVVAEWVKPWLHVQFLTHSATTTGNSKEMHARIAHAIRISSSTLTHEILETNKQIELQLKLTPEQEFLI